MVSSSRLGERSFSAKLGRMGRSLFTHMSWYRMFSRSSALEASERSIAASMMMSYVHTVPVCHLVLPRNGYKSSEVEAQGLIVDSSIDKQISSAVLSESCFSNQRLVRYVKMYMSTSSSCPRCTVHTYCTCQPCRRFKIGFLMPRIGRLRLIIIPEQHHRLHDHDHDQRRNRDSTSHLVARHDLIPDTRAAHVWEVVEEQWPARAAPKGPRTTRIPPYYQYASLLKA